MYGRSICFLYKLCKQNYQLKRNTASRLSIFISTASFIVTFVNTSFVNTLLDDLNTILFIIPSSSILLFFVKMHVVILLF